MNYKLTKAEDDTFRMTLLRDIPYFHRLWAKYHSGEELGIIQNLEDYSVTLKTKTYEL